MAVLMRALTLAAGLGGAAGLSQFPEFTQQYAQRLGGAVDELTRVIDGFDRDAAAEGLSRTDALAQMEQSGGISARRADSMAETIARHDRLSADIAALEGAGPFTRLLRLPHLADTELASRVWQSYRPALPVTFEGVVFAGTGFVAGTALVGLFGALLSPLRRRRGKRASIS
ncbi:MAG: DUF2937 family protein [Roseivivax sp.]|nr:DUF2937 family protein [Roseivivax sp.]